MEPRTTSRIHARLFAVLLLGLSACVGDCDQMTEDCKQGCFYRCGGARGEGDVRESQCYGACVATECSYSVRPSRGPKVHDDTHDAGALEDSGLDAGALDSGYTPPDEPDAGIDEGCVTACVEGEIVPECQQVYNCCFRFCNS